MAALRFFQDGAQFYDADSGQLIFEAPTPVSDFDLGAAKLARLAFARDCAERGIIAEEESE